MPYGSEMRYIDSGSRDPENALGAWLERELLGAASIVTLRVQSGFFGSDALGYFEDALCALGTTNGHTRILIGSNDGQTTRAGVADLLAVAGRPRTGLRIGVVSFQQGFFHPKVFHFQRSDGSSTAYVGSANLTGPGTTSLHVEAGLIVDDRKGDPTDVLDAIAASIDGWFTTGRPGFYEVIDNADLDPLVNARVLGVVMPPPLKRTVRPVTSQGMASTPGHSLKPLLAVPPVRIALQSRRPSSSAASPTAGQVVANSATPTPTQQPTEPSRQTAVHWWGKRMSASDADRKPGPRSTARGSIPLSQGDLRGKIDQAVWFRTQLFGQCVWASSKTRNGDPVETTWVPMHVTIDGDYLGVLEFKITDEPKRQQGKRNLPTSQLHVEPITSILKKVDTTNMHLEIALDANDEYWLTLM